jgi:hypothetical protein
MRLFGRNKAAAAAGGGQGPSPGDAIRKLKEAEEVTPNPLDVFPSSFQSASLSSQS